MKLVDPFLLSLVVGSVLAGGCSSTTSGNGAGGGPGHGGASSTGGTVGAGGVLGAGGAVGTGGSATTGGAGGAGGGAEVPDAAAPLDAPVSADASVADAVPASSIDAGATLAQIKALLASQCAGCHSGTGSAATRLDLSDRPDAATTLYQRLLGPLLLEAFCGENVDGGDTPEAHRAIVPGDPEASFLYLKITGTQPSPGNPPANCGVRMPRVFVAAVDGGAATFPSCDSLAGGAAANCLGTADIELVRRWIVAGAPE